MALGLDSVHAVAACAELLVTAAEVEASLDRMAREIAAVLGGRDPLVLCVMTGAIVVTGRLLPRLGFPLRLEYVHASRYGENTKGGQLQWMHRPSGSIDGEHILVVDDVLDEGVTLEAIAKACREDGARSVRSAVLVEKIRDRPIPFQADFVGVRVPDRYLFGYGLDYKGYLRNWQGIYAVAERHL